MQDFKNVFCNIIQKFFSIQDAKIQLYNYVKLALLFYLIYDHIKNLQLMDDQYMPYELLFDEYDL